MAKRMEFTGPMMFSYFNKCLTDNALEEWRAVTPHEDDQTAENFKYSIEEWFITLLPGNAFLTQKEWMTNTMKKPYIMKVKDFGNRLKTLNHFLTLMPHDEDKDTVSTVTNTNNLNTNNKQTYVLKTFKNQPNIGENNSQWLHNNVVNCESVYLNEIHCCESAADAIHISNLATPCINSYTHHFNL